MVLGLLTPITVKTSATAAIGSVSLSALNSYCISDNSIVISSAFSGVYQDSMGLESSDAFGVVVGFRVKVELGLGLGLELGFRVRV